MNSFHKWKKVPEKTAVVDEASSDGGAVVNLSDGVVVAGQAVGFRHVGSALDHGVYLVGRLQLLRGGEAPAAAVRQPRSEVGEGGV